MCGWVLGTVWRTLQWHLLTNGSSYVCGKNLPHAVENATLLREGSLDTRHNELDLCWDANALVWRLSYAIATATKLRAKTHFHFWWDAQPKTECSNWVDWGLCSLTTEGQVCHKNVWRDCWPSQGFIDRDVVLAQELIFALLDDESRTNTMPLTSPQTCYRTIKASCPRVMKRSSQRRQGLMKSRNNTQCSRTMQLSSFTAQ